MRNQTSVRWVCVFRDIREMRVCKQEVSVVPKWKQEIGLLVNISKHGATASKPHLASLIQASDSWRLSAPAPTLKKEMLF